MNQQRRTHRFDREPERLKSFNRTDRDEEIIRMVALCRVMTSHQLDRLFPEANPDHLRRRLQQLFHRGYLDRVGRGEAERKHYRGSSPGTYVLDTAGHKLLQDELRVRPSKVEKQLDHALAITDFIVSARQACMNSERLRFVSFPELLLGAPPETAVERRPEAWTVAVTHKGQRRTFHPEPDDIFAIENQEIAGDNRKHFFLEIDRGSMPVERDRLADTSILRKLLCYDQTFKSKVQKSRYGMEAIRVLFVTTSEERVHSMIKAHRTHIHSNPGAYLFIDRASLLTAGDAVFTAGWRNAEGIVVPSLFV